MNIPKTTLFLLLILPFTGQAQKIVSHRGASHWAPENTLASCKKAVEMGADFIEMDIRFTADGIPVLMHDGSIDRTTNGIGSINEMTLNEVKQLDAGKWFDVSFKREPVPTLEEVLIYLKDKPTLPDIDFKAGEVKVVVDLLRQYGYLEKKQVTFYSRKIKNVEAANQFTDSLLLRPSCPKSREGLIKYRDQYGVDVVNLNGGKVKKKDIDLIHKLGMLTFVNCLRRSDKVSNMKKALKYGADFIQSDQLDKLVGVVNEYK